MAITIKNISEDLENELARVYKNKTSGAETVLIAWQNLRSYTIETLKGIFTHDELLGIVDAYNETTFEPRFASHSQFLKIEMEDAEKFQNQSSKFNYDQKKILEKINKLQSAQVYFLLEEINRFWNFDSQKKNSLEEFIKKFL